MSRDAIICICTRRESRRLPGKALMEVEGVQVLQHILRRTAPSGLQAWLAVPTGQAGDFAHLVHEGAGLFEGSPDSPLHRMASLVRTWNPRPAYVVRITHDDPLIDHETMLQVLDECERTGAGYGCSPGILEGAGVEVIHTDNLLRAAERRDPTEFVSYFVRGEGMPRPNSVKVKPRQSISRNYRLTLDYPEDALALKVVLRALGPTASADAVCRYLDQRPYVLNINRLPDISFYTCARDMERFVPDTMLSVLNSGVPDMEYIVVDDGSRDGTLGEIAKFSGDRRVSLIVNDASEGLATSSNRALDEARGKVVARIDADDLLIPGTFKDMWPGLRAQMGLDQNDVLYLGYDEISEDGSPLRQNVSPAERHHAGGALMNRGWLNEHRFKDGLRHWDGLELFSRAVKSSCYGYVGTPLWQYRLRAGSMSADSPERRKALGGIGGA